VPRKHVILAAAVAASGVLLGGILWLGAWAYDTRRMSLHDARLRKVLAQAPTADRLSRGLAAEGSPLLASAGDAYGKRAAASTWGGARTAEILAKSDRFASLRVHRAGDVSYFLFFDEAGILRDYVCVP
jgi:hypothetical protein